MATLAVADTRRHHACMPGVNPALLASLNGASNPAGPSPAAPPGGTPDGGAPGDETEPDIHTAFLELHETLKAAVQMATDLQSRAEMEDDLDPKAEKAIAQTADMLTKAEALMEQTESLLGGGAGDEANEPGDSGDMPPA
jgi:hypothetical protein